jgi:hypothetical protein
MSQDWWVAKLAAAVGQHHVPLLKDLERGSPLITKLLSDTEAAAAGATLDNHIVACRVLWAEDEKVVFNDDFFRDPPGDAQYGADHISVCKPDSFGHAAARAILDQL